MTAVKRKSSTVSAKASLAAGQWGIGIHKAVDAAMQKHGLDKA